MKNLFVLQRQAIGEHQFLLDIFTAENGRLLVVTPQNKSQKTAVSPDLFQWYQADWQTAEEWPKIKVLQQKKHFNLIGNDLYCGLYLNELLVALLPPNEANAGLFKLYQHIIDGLHSTTNNQEKHAEPWLRLFETQLLQQLGLGFSWQFDSLQRPIQPQQHYSFNTKEGFVLHGAGKYSGEMIWAFQQWLNNFSQIPVDVNVWKMAKQVLRQAIEAQLTRPLISRQLFQPGQVS